MSLALEEAPAHSRKRRSRRHVVRAEASRTSESPHSQLSEEVQYLGGSVQTLRARMWNRSW